MDEVELFTTIPKRKTRTIWVTTAMAVFAFTFISVFMTTKYYNSQFRVIYSLDARDNDKQIIKIIDDAKKYVYFAIYTFTLDDIADALIRARNRGVVVWGITDAGQASSSPEEATVLEKLQAAGINVETEKHPDGIMHIKALVTDKEYATGSYNWTESATVENDELLEISKNPNLRNQYVEIIRKILLANE